MLTRSSSKKNSATQPFRPFAKRFLLQLFIRVKSRNNCRIMILWCLNRPLCTQAVAVATILAPTQKLPWHPPRREWRAKGATPCQAEPVAIFAWRRELLPRRTPGYTGFGSTSEHHNSSNHDTKLQMTVVVTTKCRVSWSVNHIACWLRHAHKHNQR